METPLHPTPMKQPMMKGKIYLNASNKPTFHGIWGMTHADVTEQGLTNSFKVERVESVGRDGGEMRAFGGRYKGWFYFTADRTTQKVKETFTLHFTEHNQNGYNVYGNGENCFGKADILGTMTKTGDMEIFKMAAGTTKQQGPSPSISSRKPPRGLGCKRKNSAAHHPSKRGRKRSDGDGGDKQDKVGVGSLEAAVSGRDDGDYDDGGHKKAKSEVDDREVDVYWLQAQQEKKEREEREKRKAAEQKALNEHLFDHLKKRNEEIREEGRRFKRERAEEKARQEAAAQEKERLKQKAIEERMAAERRIREEQRDTIDLDPVRRHPQLMALMDASVYDD